MTTLKPSKLNHLLSTIPAGVVLTSAWLIEQGYSLELQKQYRKSQWFQSIGTGAVIRKGDRVDYLGGLYALQSQLGMAIHPAAKTALALQGKSHYLGLNENRVMLFGPPGEKLPKWYESYDWSMQIDCKSSGFLPPNLGLIEMEHKSFKVRVSSPARAIMECLYLAPDHQPLMEVFELMEGLNNLRPLTVQKLLESCTSIKVKRLFLYMAEKAGHDWFSFLKTENINLGSGKRVIVPGGSLSNKYQITIPKELESGQ
ncbi:type IV toxin-antitoxin system AbiEi family antitoxin [Pantoea sp. BIGb0393]|uniref:Type IV toxin-antitoxin system AbiEi family antitoxin n=1 Tax=Pantoea nemavictus TaxID=2726955 RepID=A0ABU8PX61_9GAMM|nr:type IV toxin-antitoxin system AbiEi family antitoxin [Pantoea nemavictus]MBA0038336.1 type IV toxin-antitoxin system AbiEi family antitoxin [Pantoea nemavictus]